MEGQRKAIGEDRLPGQGHSRDFGRRLATNKIMVASRIYGCSGAGNVLDETGKLVHALEGDRCGKSLCG